MRCAELVKTTVEIEDDLIHKAKAYAAERGITFRQVVESGIRRVLEEGANARPFRMRRRSFRGRGMTRPMPWEEVRALVYEGRGE